MKPDDLDQLKDDLVHFRAPLEEPGVRAELLETALPRLLATLAAIPDSARTGDVLELGSSPYFLSLCLHRACSGALKRGNFFGTQDAQGCDVLVHGRTGEKIEFDYDLFNIERDEFPYPDASFDVVVFSELIEHMGVNPVWTLSEIHRVLRPDGHVVVTTPNALSMERLATFVRGGSQMVDRYSPLFGYGARHNREYNPWELQELLNGCGFAIEELSLRDLATLPRRERWQRGLWKLLLSLYSPMPREEHIFLRARRREPFRWTFPPSLFDNVQYFVLVRYPWVRMGINDSIQCAAGWHPLESFDADRRWTQGEGQAFLRTPEDPRQLELEVLAPGAGAGAVHVRVHDRWLGRVNPENVYVDSTFSIERGDWRTIRTPLERRPRPGDEVEVLIRLEPPSEPAERALAVRRVWLEEP